MTATVKCGDLYEIHERYHLYTDDDRSYGLFLTCLSFLSPLSFLPKLNCHEVWSSITTIIAVNNGTVLLVVLLQIFKLQKIHKNICHL